MKNKKNAKKSNEKQPKSPKKRGILPLLLVSVLPVLGVAAIFFISPAAQQKAIGVFESCKAAVASVFPKGPKAENLAGFAGSDITIRFLNNLVDRFTELEMREADYTIQHFPKDNAIEIRATIPRGRPIEWIIWNITGAARSTPFSVEDCACMTEVNCTVIFNGSSAKHPKITLNMRQAGRYLSNTAKMAILIENFGFEANQTTVEYLSFPEPLTVSLAPAQKLAAWTAQIANEYKKEVVLLLPMEPLPQQFSQYRQSMIAVHQSEEAIRSTFAQAAAAVPNFSGVSNFFGNRAMEDSRVMEIVLSEVSRRRVYFVYTDNSRRSVVPQMVRNLKVPSHPIQGTIEASLSAEQARERLRRHAVTAERTGKILIRAHPTPAFIQALKEEVEGLRRNGIRLVYVSELL